MSVSPHRIRIGEVQHSALAIYVLDPAVTCEKCRALLAQEANTPETASPSSTKGAR